MNSKLLSFVEDLGLLRRSMASSSSDWRDLPAETTMRLITGMTLADIEVLLRRVRQLCYLAPEYSIKCLNEDPALAACLMHASLLVTGMRQSIDVNDVANEIDGSSSNGVSSGSDGGSLNSTEVSEASDANQGSRGIVQARAASSLGLLPVSGDELTACREKQVAFNEVLGITQSALGDAAPSMERPMTAISHGSSQNQSQNLVRLLPPRASELNSRE